MHVSHINEFKRNDVVSVVGGSRSSFSQTVNVKNGSEQSEEAQELEIIQTRYSSHDQLFNVTIYHRVAGSNHAGSLDI